MQKEPAGVQQWVIEDFGAWPERGHEREQRRDGEKKNPEGDSPIDGGEDKECCAEEKAKHREALVRVDGQGVVRGVEHLGQRNEVKEDGDEGCGHGQVTPARAVIERGRQHRERGDAVEKNRDSEPEKSHCGRCISKILRESPVYLSRARQAARLSSAVQFGKALLDVAAHLGFDETERKKEWLVEDFDGELAVGIGVAGRDTFAAERAREAGKVDAVVAQAFCSSSELGLGEGNFNHASSVRATAGGRFSAELCRGGETVS